MDRHEKTAPRRKALWAREKAAPLLDDRLIALTLK
jgi:hypothetical protein